MAEVSRQQRRAMERGKGSGDCSPAKPAPITSKQLMEACGTARADPTDPAAWGGKLNIYTCDACRAHIVTRDIADGVTPFMLPSAEFCPNACTGRAHMTSSMYRVWNQSMREDYVWYRPAEDEVYPPSHREHVEKGGLLIRKAVAA